MNEDKMPPHDIDAEESVIGSLLLDGDYITKVVNIISPSDFFFPANALMYQSAVELYSRREKINQITLAQELSRIGRLEDCNGAAQLSHLVSICPTPLDIEHYANIVRRLSVSRQIIVLGEKMVALGYKAEPDVNATLDNIQQQASEFRIKNTTIEKLITPTDAGNQMFSMIEKYNQPNHALSWGFIDLDEITSGIYPGEFIVIGSRPGVGKTQIINDIIENVVDDGGKVLFASAEMGMNQILERKIARELKVGIKKLRRGLDIEQMDKVTQLAGEVSVRDVFYLPQGVSASEIYAEAKKMQEKVGLDLVCVDYIQFLRECWGERENQNVRVGRVCKTLKTMSLELNIPVIAASQLSRALELRAEDTRKPNLSDLRDSGNIEQDADVVLLLCRDFEDDRILEIKMAKNRQLGAAKAVCLLWNEDLHRYVNYNTKGQYPLEAI